MKNTLNLLLPIRLSSIGRTICLVACLSVISTTSAQTIDMQAHVASDEGQEAYSGYLTPQSEYYSGSAAYEQLVTLSGDELFGVLNDLMGGTCLLETSGYSYNSLRSAYVGVDRDLNTAGNIIGYYNGASFEGTWDNGRTWNREHTWPQSKGADKSIAMGHDMQSVRPTLTSVNSSRGNTPYGEGPAYYDPDEVSIDNPKYKSINLGTYRGDAARVILYDYIVYGEAGGHQNSLYNGNAQLLSKLGTGGVFESVMVLLKWHMQDPPSLTEMVRNDGAEDYQGNRNPWIDFPELAIELLLDEVSAYSVSTSTDLTMAPAYKHTTSYGFMTYLTLSDGSHPAATAIKVNGTTNYSYNETLGRLIVNGTNQNISLSLEGATAISTTTSDTNNDKIYNLLGQEVRQMQHGEVYISKGKKFIY